MAGMTDFAFATGTPDISDDPWVGEEYLFEDDGNYAYADYTGQNSTVIDFNFQIPNDAKITGVEVVAEMRRTPECSVSKPKVQTISITPDGFVTSASKTTLVTNAFVVYTFGDSGDRWGLNFTPRSFNDNLFRVNIRADVDGTWGCPSGYGPQTHCDYIKARVHYIPKGSHHPMMQTRGWKP